MLDNWAIFFFFFLHWFASFFLVILAACVWYYLLSLVGSLLVWPLLSRSASCHRPTLTSTADKEMSKGSAPSVARRLDQSWESSKVGGQARRAQAETPWHTAPLGLGVRDNFSSCPPRQRTWVRQEPTCVGWPLVSDCCRAVQNGSIYHFKGQWDFY